MDKKPFHIFIVPDGNRRWAKKNKLLLPSEGHFKGQEVFRAIVKEIWQFGVTHLTVWGLSKDNLEKRSEAEISILMKIFEQTFDELLSSEEMEEKKLHIKVIGKWKQLFPKNLTKKIKQLEEKTALYRANKNLTLLLAYNGDEELVDAINKISIYWPATWQDVRNRLWTKTLPDVDIMIRTGFEAHLSGSALMMQMANAHLYFPQKYWPDFTINDLSEIIEDFKKHERRLGA